MTEETEMKTIRRVDFDGDGCAAPGSLVIRHREPHAHPYVVHWANRATGGYHQGSYCKTLAEAEREFNRRSDKHLPNRRNVTGDELQRDLNRP